ncbi:MAG: hypothetical protein KatS3mg019_1156 [Fimbriimonadales bacterium]|nr:MAG: hypothetical protein KatS3mg019_1156 [Fimbriimonadales bacterium]
MAEMLKPVDPQELELIQKEPYEERDLSVRRMVQFLVVIFFTMVGALIISYFVFLWVLPNQRADLPSVRPEALQRQLPPEPRVQGFPMRDWEKFAAEEQRKITTYEIVDEASGKARIPVDRAKELILQKGL